MTVSNPVNKWSYDGDGVQTAFQYKTRIYAASDLLVYLRDALGVETLQTQDVDYTVDGVLDEAGGNANFGTPPAAGVTAILKVELAFTQELALPTAGLLPSGPLEIALDRLVKLCLQLQEIAGRALKFGITSPLTDVILPDPEPGKYLVGNAAGDGYDNAEPVIGTLTTVGMDTAGLVKNTATGVLQGGQPILLAELPDGQDVAKQADGSVSNANFQSLAGVTGNIQAQLNGLQHPRAILQNRQAQNTGGGTATTGSWGVVPLNAVYEDADSIVDDTDLIASHIFALEAGTYRLDEGIFPFSSPVQLVQCRLFNITDDAVQQNIGGFEMYSSSDSYTANDSGVRKHLAGTFTIAAKKQFRIEYNCAVTVATTGQGLPANRAEEVFAQLGIIKIS